MNSKLYRKAAALFLCAALTVCALPSLAYTDVAVVMTGAGGVNLRSEPKVDDRNYITTIHQYTKLEVLDKKGNWYYVRYQDYIGYVAESYVTVVSTRGSQGSRVSWDEEDYEYERPDDFLYDGNSNKAFTLMPASMMEGEYWRFGGHSVEAEGHTGPLGANLRRNMDASDDSNILTKIHGNSAVYIYCWFYDVNDNIWLLTSYNGYWGYVNVSRVSFEEYEEEDDY